MSILIKNMEMPKDKPLRIVLNPNGQLFVDCGTWFKEYKAIEIPLDETTTIAIEFPLKEILNFIESEGK